MSTTHEYGEPLLIRGVCVGDVYREASGELWEVVALVAEPQAIFARVRDRKQVSHVIGCRNMQNQFPKGPLRDPVAE